MDDFQHRLLVALERLAGRGGPTVDERFAELVAKLDEVEVRFAALIAVQQAILAKMPGRP
jgi:hypothetical protein